VLKVGSYVPRNASGGKTQEGKNTLQATAGKLRIVARGEWRLGEEAGDPWVGAKAGRWLGEGGSAIVRAGLRAWKASGVKEVDGRSVGIVGVGRGGEWPGWLEGVSAKEVVEKWREKSPLWLLEVLPNLPVAQLAVEIGARGPVETLRERDGVEGDVERRIQRWGRRGVEWVVSVQATSTGAKAEVWGWEGEK
jgi:hypothetical protein